LEICAGDVHNQLWQKTPVEETAEFKLSHRKLIMGDNGLRARPVPSVKRKPD
jgi:hypothetical protein